VAHETPVSRWGTFGLALQLCVNVRRASVTDR
jgi:hypothetical protein